MTIHVDPRATDRPSEAGSTVSVRRTVNTLRRRVLSGEGDVPIDAALTGPGHPVPRTTLRRLRSLSPRRSRLPLRNGPDTNVRRGGLLWMLRVWASLRPRRRGALAPHAGARITRAACLNVPQSPSAPPSRSFREPVYANGCFCAHSPSTSRGGGIREISAPPSAPGARQGGLEADSSVGPTPYRRAATRRYRSVLTRNHGPARSPCGMILAVGGHRRARREYSNS